MVDQIIQANDCLFQIKVGDDYQDFLCAKSFSVTIDTQEKEITTEGDGAFKAFDYAILSYTANLNGGMRIPDGLSPTAFDFVDYQKGFMKVQFRAVWIDPSGGVRAFVGTGIVKTNNLVANASQLADGTVDILGTGSYEILDTIDQFVNLTLISTGAPTVPAFVKIFLLDDQGNPVFQSDILPQANGGYLNNPFNFSTPIPPGNYYFYYYVDTNSLGNSIDLTAPPTLSAAFNNGVTEANSYPGGQVYDFTADRTVTITIGVNNPPPTCTPPAITSSNAPNGLEGTPWHGSVVVSGSLPINLTNVVKPAWMTITINGNTINMDGNSPTTGNGQTISFDINNACGSVSFSDSTDILNNPSLITLNYSFTKPGSGLGASAAFIIFKNSSELISLTSSGSGSVGINSFDQIEVRVFGQAFSNKQIDVVSSIDGNIGSDFTLGQLANVVFQAQAGHTYTATATVTNV